MFVQVGKSVEFWGFDQLLRGDPGEYISSSSFFLGFYFFCFMDLVLFF